MPNPKLNYTQAEQDYDRRYEESRKTKNLKELDDEISRTKDPSALAVLKKERSRLTGEPMGTRSIKMDDGTVISGVPDSISDETAKRRYSQKIKSPIAADEETAQKIGYDIHAARQLGLDDQTIRDFMASHPRYRTEQSAKLAAEGLNEPTKALLGFGAGVSGTARGVEQLYTESVGTPEERARLRDQEEEARARNRALGTAGQVGEIAEKAVETMLPGGVVGGIGKATGSRALLRAGEMLVAPGKAEPFERYAGGAAQGFLQGVTQPVGEQGNKGVQAFVGGGVGMAGQAAADVAGKVIRPGLSRLNESTTDLKNLAIKRYGFELPAAVQQGGNVLKGIQAGAEAIPGAGINVSRMASKNQKRLNELALSAAGGGGNEVNPTTLGDAELIVGEKFDRIKADRVRLGADYVANVSKAVAEYSKLAKPSPEAMDTLQTFLNISALPQAKIIKRGTQTTGVMIPGDVILKNRSALARDAHSAYVSGNWQLGQANEAIVDAIDDAVEASLPKNQAGLYAEARKQYKNLMIVDKSYDPKTPGDLNPARLSAAVRQTYKENYAKIPNGVDELVDAARIGEAFKFKVPDSGTASRLEGANLLRLGSIPALLGGGAAAGGAVAGPPGAVVGATIGTLTPLAMGNAFTSSGLGRYLTAPGLSSDAMQMIQIGTRGLGIPGALREQQ